MIIYCDVAEGFMNEIMSLIRKHQKALLQQRLKIMVRILKIATPKNFWPRE